MECPKCATNNSESAPVCSLCGHILQARPKGPRPGEAAPEKLENPEIKEETQRGATLPVIIIALGVLFSLLGKGFFVGYFMVLMIFLVFRLKNSS